MLRSKLVKISSALNMQIIESRVVFRERDVGVKGNRHEAMTLSQGNVRRHLAKSKGLGRSGDSCDTIVPISIAETAAGYSSSDRKMVGIAHTIVMCKMLMARRLYYLRKLTCPWKADEESNYKHLSTKGKRRFKVFVDAIGELPG